MNSRSYSYILHIMMVAIFEAITLRTSNLFDQIWGAAEDQQPRTEVDVDVTERTSVQHRM